MKPLQAIVLLLLLPPAFVAVQAKTKKPYVLPAVFNQARYVYVQAVDGQEFDLRLIPEDRLAIANVQKALNDWKRYTLVTRREDADLIIVVRAGRLAEARVSIGAGGGSQGVPGQAPGKPTGLPSGPGGPGLDSDIRSDVGSPDDLFEIFVPSPSGVFGSPLWRRTLVDGLSGPNPVIFQQFKNAVEHDYPSQTASQPQKP